MKRAIIIDDELIGLNSLQLLIEKYTPEIKIVGGTTDADKGISLINDYQPEVLFLDISMPQMSGFELLEKVNFKEFKVVFTTAHREHAIKAIKSKAHDYLLKPIDITELQKCVHSLLFAEEKIEKRTTFKTIQLHVKDGVIFIRQDSIIRLEASGSYTTFFLENNIKHMASKNLKECEKLLDPEIFYRCHPSHIINLKKVVRMITTDGLFAKMTDDSSPDIVRKNKDVFLQRLKSI